MVLSSEIPKTTPDQDENTILNELDMKSLIIELVKSNTEFHRSNGVCAIVWVRARFFTVPKNPIQ